MRGRRTTGPTCSGRGRSSSTARSWRSRQRSRLPPERQRPDEPETVPGSDQDAGPSEEAVSERSVDDRHRDDAENLAFRGRKHAVQTKGPVGWRSDPSSSDRICGRLCHRTRSGGVSWPGERHPGGSDRGHPSGGRGDAASPPLGQRPPDADHVQPRRTDPHRDRSRRRGGLAGNGAAPRRRNRPFEGRDALLLGAGKAARPVRVRGHVARGAPNREGIRFCRDGRSLRAHSARGRGGGGARAGAGCGRRLPRPSWRRAARRWSRPRSSPRPSRRRRRPPMWLRFPCATPRRESPRRSSPASG